MENWKPIKRFEKEYVISDIGRVKSINGRLRKLSTDRHGYKCLILFSDGKSYFRLINRLVYEMFVGDLIPGFDIDHKDNNKTNNIPGNLQQITRRLNCSKDQHRRNKSSKYVGVCFSKYHRKWISKIRINNKREHLGMFESEENAHLAYQKRLKEITFFTKSIKILL